MTLPKSVQIREVGAREGFQTLSQVVPTADKLALIKALNATNVGTIEVASFVRPDRVPQMADAEEVVARYERKASVKYFGLYLNDKGFARAEQSKRLDNQAWIYTASSERFLKENNNSSIDKINSEIPAWLKLFRDSGKDLHGLMLSAAFGSNWEGRIASSVSVDVLTRTIQKISEHGAKLKEISLADTMGWAVPETVKRLVADIRLAYPQIEISLHLHDTRGAGLASAYAGLSEGVAIFEASVGGIGGCPFAKGAAGNICTEDMAWMFEECGVSTGLDLKAYIEAAKFAEKIVGHSLPGKLYKAQSFL